MSQPPSQELAKKLLAFKYTLGEGGEPQDDGNPLMKGRWLDALEQYVSTSDDDLLLARSNTGPGGRGVKTLQIRIL